MAKSASTVWEIRPTVGSDANGGGYVSGGGGTDYSQQDSAQYSFTDLVIDASNAAKVTSASHSFVTADIGNIFQVPSGTGFTTGFYQILSVSAGAATLDRNCGSTSSTGGHWVLGGALATLTPLITTSVYSQINSENGNTFWVKGTAGDLVVAASQHNFNVYYTFIGYGSTRGDGVRAIIKTSTNSVDLFQSGNGEFIWLFINFSFQNTAGTRGKCLSATDEIGYVLFDNCIMDGFTNAVGTTQWVKSLSMRNCEIKNCTGDGIVLANNSCLNMHGCYVHDNGQHGVNIGPGRPGLQSFVNCTFYNNTGRGVYNAGDQNSNSDDPTMNFVNTNIVSNGGDGIHFTGSGSTYFVLLGLHNCIIYGNGGWGVLLGVGGAGATPVSMCYGKTNAFGSNTSGNFSGGTNGLIGSVTLTADPFTNKSAGDFTLNATAGGGAACAAAGFETSLF